VPYASEMYIYRATIDENGAKHIDHRPDHPCHHPTGVQMSATWIAHDRVHAMPGPVGLKALVLIRLAPQPGDRAVHEICVASSNTLMLCHLVAFKAGGRWRRGVAAPFRYMMMSACRKQCGGPPMLLDRKSSRGTVNNQKCYSTVEIACMHNSAVERSKAYSQVRFLCQ
jgi:hypothetical protein